MGPGCCDDCNSQWIEGTKKQAFTPTTVTNNTPIDMGVHEKESLNHQIVLCVLCHCAACANVNTTNDMVIDYGELQPPPPHPPPDFRDAGNPLSVPLTAQGQGEEKLFRPSTIKTDWSLSSVN